MTLMACEMIEFEMTGQESVRLGTFIFTVKARSKRNGLNSMSSHGELDSHSAWGPCSVRRDSDYCHGDDNAPHRSPKTRVAGYSLAPSSQT